MRLSFKSLKLGKESPEKLGFAVIIGMVIIGAALYYQRNAIQRPSIFGRKLSLVVDQVASGQVPADCPDDPITQMDCSEEDHATYKAHTGIDCSRCPTD